MIRSVEAAPGDLSALPVHLFGESRPGEDAIWVASGRSNLTVPPPRFVDGVEWISSSMQAYLAEPQVAAGPALAYAVFHDASVLDEWLIVDRHGRHHLPLAPGYLQGRMRDRGVFDEVTGPARARHASDVHRPGDSLLLPLTGTAISHFVAEAFGHLSFFDPGTCVITLFVPPVPALRELLTLAGYDVDRDVVHRSPVAVGESFAGWTFESDRRWTFERLIVPIHGWHPNPAAMPVFRRVAKRLGAAPDSELLYVSRRDGARHRMLLDEEDLIEALDRRGFRILTCSEHDEASKLAAFRGAKLVVGALGAGLCNTMFTSGEPLLVGLSGGTYLRPFFAQCATLAGHDYAWCIGPEFLSFESRFHRGRHNDFVMDLPRLCERLDRLLDADGGRRLAG